MQRGADKLRARCFMKQHASRDARVPGSLAAQPRPASVAPSAGRDRAARVDPWPSGPDATRALGRTPQRPECRALGCATYMGAPLTDRRFLCIDAQHQTLFPRRQSTFLTCSSRCKSSRVKTVRSRPSTTVAVLVILTGFADIGLKLAGFPPARRPAAAGLPLRSCS